MVKKALITSGITIVFALAVFMVYSMIEQQTAKKLVQTKIQSTPVNVNLFTLDSTRFIFPLAKPVVFILYNSTCEHCQYELTQIRASMHLFKDVELVFLSSEPISAIKKVALLFESHRNVNFIKINPEDVYDNFGTVRYPTILIYGTNGKLIKEFKGETKVEAILRYARQ